VLLKPKLSKQNKLPGILSLLFFACITQSSQSGNFQYKVLTELKVRDAKDGPITRYDIHLIVKIELIETYMIFKFSGRVVLYS